MNYRVTTLILVLAVAGCAPWLASAQDSDRVPPFALVDGYEVLRCDFHMHTPHSDGDLTPVERVEEAIAHHYDAIAITDHGNFRAHEEALPRANELGLILIRGMETGLNDREHLVALDFAADYEPVNPHRWALNEDEDNVYYREQWRRLVEDAGAYVIYAHPHKGFEEPVRWALDEGLLHGIEIKNGVVGQGWATVESHGTWFYPFAHEWALEHGLTVFANSDVHGERAADNSPVTLVLVEERSPEGVMQALRAGRTIAWFNGMLWGKESLLEAFVKANVAVTRGDGIDILNRGSAALTVSAQNGDRVEVAPFAAASIPLETVPDDLTLTWHNVWVTPEKNLQTTH